VLFLTWQFVPPFKLCYTAHDSNLTLGIGMERRFVLLGALGIGLIAIVTYLSALKIQFYDGWWYLIWSATMDLPRYLVQFLNPANITQGYRPVQGLYMYLLYHLFGFNPDGYHWAHNLLHAANAILFFLIVGKLSKRWRLAFIAATIYAVLPNYSLAVFWHAVVDPLSCFFYLLTILLWTRFVDTQYQRDGFGNVTSPTLPQGTQRTQRRNTIISAPPVRSVANLNYALAFIAFVLALFSKEIAIFLPLFLFLIAWWFYGIKPNLRVDIPRYLPFLITFIPYLWLVYQVQSHGEFVGQFGFHLGPHMLNNLIPYAAVLTFPWLVDLPTDPIIFIWLAIVVVVYVGIMIYKRSAILLFLALFAVLNVSPLLGFPLDYFSPRYLYLSTMVSAILLALIFEMLWQFVRARRWLVGVWVIAIAFIVVVSSARVAESAGGLAEYTRQLRVPFNDIARQHPTFPPGTYVYLVNSPKTPAWDFEGLFFARYRKNVTVDATDGGDLPRLREYDTPYVYYFDPTGKPIEIRVDPNDLTRVTPTLPARFQSSIILEQAAVPSNVARRDRALVTILVWRAAAIVETDYTIFAHLVDASGKIIAQSDALPAGEPTSQWRPTRQYVHAIVLPIDATTPSGTYRLEVGLYDAATMERLPVLDAHGQPIGDKLAIEPFNIVGE